MGKLEQAFLQFPLSVSFHQFCTLIIIIDVLLSPQRQMGEAWEPSKKQYCFGKWRSIRYKSLFPSILQSLAVN